MIDKNYECNETGKDQFGLTFGSEDNVEEVCRNFGLETAKETEHCIRLC